MTSPTRISTEEINGRKFTVDRALFVTPRGGCGVRHIHRIDGKLVSADRYYAVITAAEGTRDITGAIRRA